MEIITKSPTETQILGKKIGALLKGGEILALKAELGAGKTTFVQGLAEGMGLAARVISPTFLLMRKYPGKTSLYHMDLYRIDTNVDTELLNLGVLDLWGQESNVFVIEWAEKISKLPEGAIVIEISGSDDIRHFKLVNLPSYISDNVSK